MYNKSIPSNAFIGQSTITSVTFGSKCASVGTDAFKDCISLEEINDDNVIEKIYAGAFANTKLSSVKFSKLKSIIGSFVKSGAFESCSHLTYVNIPSCKNIGMYAFSSCIKLKDVKINNLLNGNTISIDPYAFCGCGSLKNIDLRNCSKIGNQAFSGCTSIENAHLYKCILIGQSAFFGCTKLKEIHLSSCIIGSYAFFNCNNLSKVYINTTPEQSCISLSGDYIFYYNISQNSGGSPIWPKNLLPQQSTYSIISNIRFYLGADIFDKYTNEKDAPQWSVYKDYMVKLPGENQILYTTIKENNEEINVDGSKYGGISSHEYANNTGLIEFNESVAELNQKIFQNNTEITSICLPSNCILIGDNEFEGCTSLDTFTPSPLNVLKKIGNCAFKDCASLKSFTIPESIEELGEGIFAGCKNIEKFEGKFTSYNGKAVVYTNILISVAPKDDVRYYKILDINSNITRLGKYCFCGCENLRRVDIQSNIKSIGDYAFERCTNLQEVHFYGNSLTKIEKSVFQECEKLENISIPNNVISIEDFAFAGCKNEKLVISLPKRLKKLGHCCLATGTSKTIIYIPNSLSRPPIFTMGEINSGESYPFGKENIPNIYVPSKELYDIYINNKYWSKYKDNINIIKQ